ncbi:MAG: DUF6159 family protein [Actinomycetota bacterium]
METIRRGFRLLGASWQVLKADRELLVLPVISFIFIMIASAGLGFMFWSGGAFEQGAEQFPRGPVDYVLLFVFYFVAYFIGIFFNAAVVGAATIRLEGGDPTLSDGLRLAWSKKGKIAAWAAVSATVGLILRSLEERAGFIGRIVINIIGAAWSVITFFVVPVLLYEPLGVGQGIKRSATIFKQRWGETFVGAGAIGIASIIIAIPLGVATGVLGVISVPLAVIVGVLGFGLLIAVSTALSGIFNAALYRYATTGQAPGSFSEEDLRGSFKQKGRRSGLLGGG